VRHLLPILGLALLAGCAPPTEAEPPARDALVVTLDTLRADHLGSYGYPRDTTPNLDALAARGVRFEGCRAPMATTLPSHLSLFTGAHPLRHGVLANLVGDTVYERDPGLVTLAEELGEAGYATAAFVGAYVLRAGAGRLATRPGCARESVARFAVIAFKVACAWSKGVASGAGSISAGLASVASRSVCRSSCSSASSAAASSAAS
jgi:hypothetical protein